MKTIAEYSQNNILVIPQALFAMSDVMVLAHYRDSIVFYKDLKQDLLDIEFYTNCPCLIYIDSGQEAITTSDNESLELNAGSSIFLPQGLTLHSDFVRTTQALKAYLVFFDNDIINEYLSHCQGVAKSFHHKSRYCLVQDRGTFKPFFDSLTLQQSMNINSPELLRLKLLELLHLFAWEDHAGKLAALLSERSTQKPRRNLLRLMAKPEIFQLSVADLAHISGRSLSSFNREFKTTFGVAPKQWLLDKKLAYSMELISDKELTVTEVAMQIGYDNVSHFIKVFKQRYGVTPKQIKSMK